MAIEGVDHLGLTVSDLDRSTGWYCDHLGFVPFVRYTNAAAGAEVQVLRLEGSPMRLSLRRFDDGDPAAFDERRIGLDHVALRVSDDNDLAAWQVRLEDVGVRCDRTDLPELSILVFRDPDNIQIELCTTLRV